MKYVIYLIFAAFIAVLILFLKSALEPEKEPVSITGSVKCGECHSLQSLGNQQTIWQSSAHSKAYKMLSSQKAADYVTKNNLVEADKNKVCLRCHTTDGFLEDKEKLGTYKSDEGVGCEACHGAGSKYSPDEIMKSPHQFKQNGGLVSGEETCLKCHNLKGSKEMKLNEYLCPFQTEDFVYKTELEKIKHPLNKDNFK